MISYFRPAIRLAFCKKLAATLAAFIFAAVSATAQTNVWTLWGSVSISKPVFGTPGAQLASDGTNLYYSTLLDGLYKAPLATRIFSPMPLTGYPAWNQVDNTNGYGIGNLAVAPDGTLLMSGSPESLVNHSLGPAPGYNTLPPFYWWDASNQLWHAAIITGKSYPYTTSAGNFSIAPDGSVWACSGFYSYAYRSTNNGHSYTAFDINASVPTNYFPLPLSGDEMSFGKVFSILAGPKNEVVIGTETGGYLHTTNNGLRWTSLDPDFTNTQTLNPLGRTGNSFIAGLDHYGNFLCANDEFAETFAGETNWDGITLIGYNPNDGTYFNAADGFPQYFGPSLIVTPNSGVSYTFMAQNYQLQGGIYRSPNGKNWTQFNNNIPGLAGPFSTNLINSVIPGNCITTVGNQIFVATGNRIGIFDSTPLPVTNRPPSAFPQNINLVKNTTTNFILTGLDTDGNALHFTLTTLPLHGALSGTPPALSYSPANNFTGTDRLFFITDDGMATSAPALINFAVYANTNPLPSITLTSPTIQNVLVAPANVVLSATASDPNGAPKVSFFSGTNSLSSASNPPYTFTWTNPPPGEYTLNACVVNSAGATIWALPAALSVLPVRPLLQIQNAGINVAVTWPSVLDNNYFVESAASATGPWTLCPYPPQFPVNGQTVTVPLADRQFFRLMHLH